MTTKKRVVCLVKGTVIIGGLLVSGTGCRTWNKLTKPSEVAMLSSRNGRVPTALYTVKPIDVATSPTIREQQPWTNQEPIEHINQVVEQPKDSFTPEPPKNELTLPTYTPSTEKLTIYKVRKNDCLSRIAYRYGVSYRELAAINGISVKSVLKVDQELKIPAGGKPRATGNRTSSKTSKPKNRTIPATTANGKYIVKQGDNIWLIAKRFHVKRDDLMAINKLTTARLSIGQVLVMPKGNIKPTTTTPKTDNPTTVVETDNPTVEQPPTTESKSILDGLSLLDHKVLDGDTRSIVAEMYESTVEWIEAANPTIKGKQKLPIGVTLKIPFKDNK